MKSACCASAQVTFSTSRSYVGVYCSIRYALLTVFMSGIPYTSLDAGGFLHIGFLPKNPTGA
jgi:hypothetical protein